MSVEGEVPTSPEVRFAPIADRINTGVLVFLVILRGVAEYAPEVGTPTLTTAFPYAAGVALAVTFAGYGIDAGVLPTVDTGEGVRK